MVKFIVIAVVLFVFYSVLDMWIVGRLNHCLNQKGRVKAFVVWILLASVIIAVSILMVRWIITEI